MGDGLGAQQQPGQDHAGEQHGDGHLDDDIRVPGRRVGGRAGCAHPDRNDIAGERADGGEDVGGGCGTSDAFGRANR